MNDAAQSMAGTRRLAFSSASLRLWFPPALLACVLLLYPFARFAEVPLALMALAGGWVLVRHWTEIWSRPATSWLAVLFLAWWVPVTLSAVDSAAPAESWRVSASLLRYFLVGIFAIWFLRRPQQLRWLTTACAVILSLWVIDALVQAAIGYNLLIMPKPDRLNGVFGVDHLKLGPVLAVLIPLLLFGLRGAVPGWFRVLLVAGAVAVILMTGTRAAWVLLAVMLGVSVWRARKRRTRALAIVLLTLLFLGGTAVALYSFNGDFRQRAERTLAVLDGDWASLDRALSSRLPIWHASLDMFVAHPVNGVGARAFREHYPVHARARDPWVSRSGQGGAMYAHHYLLEVVTETGIMGLLGLLLVFLVLLHAWSGSDPGARRRAAPFGIAILLAFFPLNTHYAIYSTFWSILLWWLMIVYLVALTADVDGEDGRG